MTNKYRIESPVRSFTGECVGVHFQKGTGYVEDSDKPGRAALEYFRRHGYGVAREVDDELDITSPAGQMKTEGQQIGTEAVGGIGPNPFNPSEHSVEDVLAYLGEADSAEALRVLDAEASSKKPRISITGKRDETLAAKAPAAPAGDDTKGAGK
jgi:hypothetical protein